jgi:hypothetical protein
LALLIKSTKDYGRAVELTPALLETLSRMLVSGQIAPEEWASRAGREALVLGESTGDQAYGGSLEGLESIARFVRRRQVRQTLPRLALPELTAVLLRHVADRPTAAMIGLVGENLERVEQALLSAYEKLASGTIDAAPNVTTPPAHPDPAIEADASVTGPAP